METLYLTHPACRLHDMGDWHPESPQRLDAISDQLVASGLMNFLDAEHAAAATRAQIERVHDPEYVAGLFAHTGDAIRTIDSDTLQGPHTLSAALHAAGAAVAGVDAVMRGRAQTAFCAVRPPGHHAGRRQAMGFCFFNNIAVAAQYAIDAYDLRRVAIIDFDVHHGNGTEEIFAGDPKVLMCSFFQHPFFPHSGAEPLGENMLNVPVPAYCTGATIREVVTEQWLARLDAFAPELVLVSAGFDAHREDEMGQLGLVESDFAWLTEQIVALADRHAKGRIVSVLEGGYSLSALGRSVVAHVRSLAKL